MSIKVKAEGVTSITRVIISETIYFRMSQLSFLCILSNVADVSFQLHRFEFWRPCCYELVYINTRFLSDSIVVKYIDHVPIDNIM